MNSSKLCAIDMSIIFFETANDNVFQMVIQLLKSGKLQHCKEKHVCSYKNISSELTVSETDLLLRNRRIVLQKSLKVKTIIIAHEGHLGMTKTKNLIRSKVWYPTMDRMVEITTTACHECAINNSNTHPEPLQMSAIPKDLWMNIYLDFCGPLPSGDYLVVIMDAYSRCAVVETTRSLADENIILIIDNFFAMFAYPIVMKTDNLIFFFRVNYGPNYASITM